MSSEGEEALEAQALALFEEALDQPSNRRVAWIYDATADHPELRARTLRLLQADKSMTGGSLTGGAIRGLEEDADAAPERIGQYRIIRLIGRGGMGAVYLGERDAGDFDHRVAIKIVRGLTRSERLSERLRVERQTLAGLQHPNIAQLFDGGETDDGMPYFIMEYVDGVPLATFLEQSASNLDIRLRMFRQIAEAVAYAHQNLIVHRDLSPHNILVTEDGQIKLIDFGISRSYADDDGADTAPSYTMTKAYASPERLKGAPATTLSDIYALGLILRDMVADLPAHHREDLEAIWRQASAKASEDRYAGVGMLLDDLKNYRAGQPVSAVNGGPGYRFRRFMGRRRLAVGAGLAAAVALMAGSAAMTVLYLRAEAAEQQAVERFNEVRSLANTLMFDIYDVVAPLAGTTAAREKILETVTDYLERVAEIDNPDAELQLEIANGFYRLGDLQGDFSGASLGLIEEGQANMDRAETYYAAVTENHPDYAKALNDYAYFLTKQANTFIFRERNTEKGTEAVGRAVPLIDRAVAMEPDNIAYLLTRLNVESMKGQALQYGGDRDGAIEVYRDVAALTEEYAERTGDEDLLYTLASNRRNLGTSLIDTGQNEEAHDVLVEAAAAIDRYLADHPESGDGRKLKMIIHWQNSAALQRLERYPEAREEILKGLSIVDQTIADDPDNANARREKAILTETVAVLDAEAGNHESARAAADDVFAYFEGIYAANPDDPGSTMDVIYAYSFIVDIYQRTGEEDQACALFRDGDALYQEYLTRESVMSEDREFYGEYSALGEGCGS